MALAVLLAQKQENVNPKENQGGVFFPWTNLFFGRMKSVAAEIMANIRLYFFIGAKTWEVKKVKKKLKFLYKNTKNFLILLQIVNPLFSRIYGNVRLRRLCRIHGEPPFLMEAISIIAG